jgi:glycosyltransferase involved in cell wall biosynthesis
VKPFVSILIPAFNAQEWIADTIRSAVGQTWPRKEVIIVDDGSTDQTFSVARQFASKEVKVVTQPNEGAAAARNRAFSLCQGDYIQWLDADDLLDPDKITQQMRVAEHCGDSRILLSCPWGRFIYRVNRAKFIPTSLWRDLSPVEWLICKMVDNLFMQTDSWLVSRDLCEAAGPWDTRQLSDDDGEYFCRIILASNGIRFVPEAKAFYRVTCPNRLSYVGQSEQKQGALLLSIQLHVQYLRSLEDSARVRVACVRFLQNFLIYFYPERPNMVAELETLAVGLGGRLKPPRLRWKYAWMKPLFGWDLAKRAQLVLPQLKASILGSWDAAMYQLENRLRT